MASEIKVTKTCNPTPVRKWDWQAWYGDLDLGSIVGDGATPNEAIADLEDRWEARKGAGEKGI